jgi:hypothetical protein
MTILLIILIYFVATAGAKSREKVATKPDYAQMYSEPPGYTSGATMRISGVYASDLRGDYMTKLGEKEGEFYARYFSSNEDTADKIRSPTYKTAVSF